MSSQIENLSNEFNMLISDYQDTYQNYINAINSDNKNLKTIDNFSFTGKHINTLNNSSLSNCEELCLSNTKCSGATFNNNSQSCILSSSPGSLVNTPQSTAIVQEAIFYSYKLQELNTKLTDINKQIMDINNSNSNSNALQVEEKEKQNKAINYNYEILANERNEIEKMIREQETLNAANNDGEINVSSNYYVYISLLIITVLLIFLLINFSLPNQQRGGGKFTSLNNNKLITVLGIFVLFLIYKIVNL